MLYIHTGTEWQVIPKGGGEDGGFVYSSVSITASDDDIGSFCFVSFVNDPEHAVALPDMGCLLCYSSTLRVQSRGTSETLFSLSLFCLYPLYDL